MDDARPPAVAAATTDIGPALACALPEGTDAPASLGSSPAMQRLAYLFRRVPEGAPAHPLLALMQRHRGIRS